MPSLRDPIWQFVGVAISVIALAVAILQEFLPPPDVLNHLQFINTSYMLFFATIPPFIMIIFGWVDNNRLKQHIHDGLKYTKNRVKITVDLKRKVYRFSFEKHFVVISSERPKWYKGQFYCNRYLENNEQTKEYYKANTPKWSELNVFANLKYCPPNSFTFSQPIKLKVVPITDDSYYIPFHIHYESESGANSTISLVKGTKVILNYGYEVSANLWGSYLNRTLSFFGEPSQVVFQYPYNNSSDVEVSLHRLSSSDGSPERIKKCEITSLQDNKIVYEIDLPRVSFARFRIWWDSDTLLGVQKTNNTADDSHMTNY